MKKTIGVFAHVDAGKTTFTEQLLYCTGSIKNLGRVDYKTSCMDNNNIEQNRGITIFADQGVFKLNDDTYYIIDTPGHMDFSAETERSISALDYAVLIISSSSAVQANTITLFRLLETYRIPTFIFVNKIDIDTFNLETIINDIKNKLTIDLLYLSSPEDISTEHVKEFVADRDEIFLESYLQNSYTYNNLVEAIKNLIKKRACFILMKGSALKGIGIDNFLNIFSIMSDTKYHIKEDEIFIGKVFKIRHDDNGTRLTFVKALSGKLSIKDEFTFAKDGVTYTEKVNEIRIYNGKRYENMNKVYAGDVFAVVGLKLPLCSSKLISNQIILVEDTNFQLKTTMQSKIDVLDKTNIKTLMEKLYILESEDPMLKVTYRKGLDDIIINVMGKIQLEILEQLIKDRFNILVSFNKPRVQYKETISSNVIGYGHYEPYRHYAEVKLRLEPGARGSGITYENQCRNDNLIVNYQNTIENHIFDKIHKGVLTGSPITDIKIILLDGHSHVKHTSGGDFREATYRAIRQGLEKAKSVLLEPYYTFEIYALETFMGRIISDIQKLRGTCNSPVFNNGIIYIKGRGPVESFMNFSEDLSSYTKGTANINFSFDGHGLCENAREVIEQIGYNKEKDLENSSSSVFCGKGNTFIIPWQEAEKYMHTI